MLLFAMRHLSQLPSGLPIRIELLDVLEEKWFIK